MTAEEFREVALSLPASPSFNPNPKSSRLLMARGDATGLLRCIWRRQRRALCAPRLSSRGAIERRNDWCRSSMSNSEGQIISPLHSSRLSLKLYGRG